MCVCGIKIKLKHVGKDTQPKMIHSEGDHLEKCSYPKSGDAVSYLCPLEGCREEFHLYRDGDRYKDSQAFAGHLARSYHPSTPINTIDIDRWSDENIFIGAVLCNTCCEKEKSDFQRRYLKKQKCDNEMNEQKEEAEVKEPVKEENFGRTVSNCMQASLLFDVRTLPFSLHDDRVPLRFSAYFSNYCGSVVKRNSEGKFYIFINGEDLDVSRMYSNPNPNPGTTSNEHPNPGTSPSEQHAMLHCKTCDAHIGTKMGEVEDIICFELVQDNVLFAAFRSEFKGMYSLPRSPSLPLSFFLSLSLSLSLSLYVCVCVSLSLSLFRSLTLLSLSPQI